RSLRSISENRKGDRVWLEKQQFASRTISSTPLSSEIFSRKANQDASNVLPEISPKMADVTRQQVSGSSFDRSKNYRYIFFRQGNGVRKFAFRCIAEFDSFQQLCEALSLNVINKVDPCFLRCLV
ncbi:MAG TPA: hypothetical protein VNO32_18485, partial [Candidatus Acidoferrum sp.]|nr:hypothetical protein [Candidatus Acidoferrum sp.]